MPFPSLAKVKRYFIYWFEGTNAIFSPGPAGLSFSNRRSHSNSEPLLTLAIRLKMGAKQSPGASWAPPVAQPGNIVCPRAPPTADVTLQSRLVCARDVCSICTNAKLTYAREWQEAPTPPTALFHSDNNFTNEPFSHHWVQVPRWMVD